MDRTQKSALLKTFPLFANLTKEELYLIADVAVFQTFPVETTIIEQDDESRRTYFICKGTCKVFRITEEGNEINLAILGPGEVVGELALLDNSPRSASVTTLQDVEMLRIDGNAFQRVLVTQPKTAVELLRRLAERIRLTNQHMEDVLSKNVLERTWQILQTLTPLFPNGEITLSQEELSYLIGATRARVTEALNSLQDGGKIVLAHKKILLP